MNGLSFRILYPDGKTEELVVEADSVLVGSGAHCEIRLPAEHAAVEHVLIQHTGGAIYVHARTMSPPPFLNGSPFTQAPLLQGSVLALGQVQMTVAIAGGDATGAVVQKKQKKTNPLLLIAAAVVFPAAALSLLDDDGKYDVGDVPDAPALWAESPAACSQSAKDLAVNLARDKKVAAEGKRERCPFYIPDCVQSVPTFEIASACFKTAGDDEMSREMTSDATALRTRLNEEYRGHQMRLEHSIQVGDLRSAQKQVKILLAMLDGKSGPYVTWLSNHDRRLALILGRSKEAPK